jgi:class 3 adenylate cyclase/GAF domain-containing protein
VGHRPSGDHLTLKMSRRSKSELNAQLREASNRIAELETARLRAETLFAVTQALGKTLSLQDTFETILGQLQRVVPYDSSSVQVIQDNRLVIVGGRGFDNPQAILGVGFELGDETNPSIQVLRSKRQHVFADVSQHPHFASQLHGGGRIRGWICAPLIFGDRVIGVITLDKFEPDFYNDDLAELVTAFAAQAATAIENARLLEAERAAREQSETLRAAAHALSSTLSLHQVFDLILSELRKAVPYDSCSVQQIDGNEMVIVGGKGFANLDELLGQRFNWGGPDDPASPVVERRELVIIPNVSARFEHFRHETHGGGRVKGWMGVPLLSGDRLIGMLTLDKLEEGFYTPEHGRLVQAFAAFATSAIENARLFETERAAREQAETLRAAAQSLDSTLSLPEVFDLILSELRKVVPYDSCSVQQMDGSEMVIVGGHGFPNLGELLGQRFDWRGPDDPAGEVVERREPVIIPDVSARFEHFKDETHGGGRVKGWMGVPLLFGDSLIGMLTLDKLDADFYTAEHAHMAGAFAPYAAAAIERARLFNEVESLLEEAKDARGRLVDAVENSSEGFVFFDADDRLVLCNTRYRELLYPGARFPIDPGMGFEAIIRAAAENGYVADAEHGIDEWVAERLAIHRNPGEPWLQQRSDGRWLLITERRTGDGGSVAIFSDITDLKQREAELTEKSNALQQLSQQLAKYLSPQIYDSIFAGRQEVKLASQRKRLTVFFSDIASFTETTERLQPEDLSQLLNHYLTEMSEIALAHGATIDKYVGDAILIFFGDPETRGDKEDAVACVTMALAMRKRIAELQAAWESLGIRDPLRCRMGINTGVCTVGNFGSEDRMDYTIVGADVNLAARLETACPPDEVLISHQTYALVRDVVCCEEHGHVEAKGIANPVATYRVIDLFENLGEASRPIHATLPHLRLDVDVGLMSAEEQQAAAAVLREAARRLASAKTWSQDDGAG